MKHLRLKHLRLKHLRLKRGTEQLFGSRSGAKPYKTAHHGRQRTRTHDAHNKRSRLSLLPRVDDERDEPEQDAAHGDGRGDQIEGESCHTGGPPQGQARDNRPRHHHQKA